jgi:hypothetical protein
MLDDLFMRIRAEFHEKMKAVETWVHAHLDDDGKLAPSDKVIATQKLADAAQSVAVTASDKHSEAEMEAETTDTTQKTTTGANDNAKPNG